MYSHLMGTSIILVSPSGILPIKWHTRSTNLARISARQSCKRTHKVSLGRLSFCPIQSSYTDVFLARMRYDGIMEWNSGSFHLLPNAVLQALKRNKQSLQFWPQQYTRKILTKVGKVGQIPEWLLGGRRALKIEVFKTAAEDFVATEGEITEKSPWKPLTCFERAGLSGTQTWGKMASFFQETGEKE